MNWRLGFQNWWFDFGWLFDLFFGLLFRRRLYFLGRFFGNWLLDWRGNFCNCFCCFGLNNWLRLFFRWRLDYCFFCNNRFLGWRLNFGNNLCRFLFWAFFFLIWRLFFCRLFWYNWHNFFSNWDFSFNLLSWFLLNNWSIFLFLWWWLNCFFDNFFFFNFLFFSNLSCYNWNLATWIFLWVLT